MARTRNVAVSVVILVLLVAGGGLAHSLPTFSRTSATASLPASDASGAVTATCPKGHRLTAGGVRLDEPYWDYLQGSHPRKDNAWRAAGYRPSTASGPSNVTAFALCVRKAGAVTVRRKKADLSGGKPVAVVVRCAKGSAAVGGGVRLQREDADYVQGVHPVGPRAWRVVGLSPSGEEATVTGFVVCLDGARTRLVSRSTAMKTDKVGTVKAPCPRGTRLVGGGVQVQDLRNDFASGSFPTKNAWTAQGFPAAGGNTLTAHAVCLR